MAFLFDFLGLIGQIFPVLRLSDIPYLLKFFAVAPAGYKFLMLFGLVAMVALAQAIWWAVKRPEKVEALVLVNLFVFFYLIEIQFGGASHGQVWKFSGKSLVGSQAVFGYDSRNTGFVDSLSGEGQVFSDVKVSGVTGELFTGRAQGDILLVINESWGVTNQDIFQGVIAPLLDGNDGIIDIQFGELPFRGITIAAEFRELCQLYPNHFNFNGQEERLSGCLPNLLKESGYKTHAFHGAGGLMYDRVKWYPVIGFDQMTFFESRQWERRCYSFPGACDSDMLGEVRRSFDTEGDVFSYWLTLNTHSLYDQRDIHIDLFDCHVFDVPDSSQTCRNLKLQSQFFYDLRILIESPEMKGVEVIVVGDHEPPIMNKVEKDKFFVGGSVPWVRFRVSESNL